MATSSKSLSNLEKGKFVALEKVHPVGTLQARKDAAGVVTFYWRCTHEGKDFREVIGVFDPKSPPLAIEPTASGLSRRAAAIKAGELATLHKQHLSIGGLAGYRLQVEQARQAAELAQRLAAEEKQRQQEAAARAEEARTKYNLKALLIEYCEYLRELGRTSHSDARSIFTLHVIEAFPEISAKPAADVTPEEVADMMRRLIEKGKDRTANKLRSYMRAAYQVAKAARSKPSIPMVFKAYGITGNPAAETSPDESANRADKSPLSIDELRTYWGILQKVEGIAGVALRLHLLLGGQRVAQLVRLLDKDVGEKVATLYDGKGRPGKPARPHALPIVPAVETELAACAANKPHRLSTDGGKTHIFPGTLTKWASEAVGEKIPNFQLKRVRSGVETALASAKVPKEYRGRLQSHGITGVQATHYDGHDYIDEKRECLDVLHRLLTMPKGVVVDFPKRTAA